MEIVLGCQEFKNRIFEKRLDYSIIAWVNEFFVFFTERTKGMYNVSYPTRDTDSLVGIRFWNSMQIIVGFLRHQSLFFFQEEFFEPLHL